MGQISWKKHNYGGVRFNVINVMMGWVGVWVSLFRKKSNYVVNTNGILQNQILNEDANAEMTLT